MVPAGAPTESTVSRLSADLSSGDVVIGGQHELPRRCAGLTLASRGIHYIDAGTSGGVWGRRKATASWSAIPGGSARVWNPSSAPAPPDGYLRVGDAGAGHVKMIHNAIRARHDAEPTPRASSRSRGPYKVDVAGRLALDAGSVVRRGCSNSPHAHWPATRICLRSMATLRGLWRRPLDTARGGERRRADAGIGGLALRTVPVALTTVCRSHARRASPAVWRTRREQRRTPPLRPSRDGCAHCANAHQRQAARSSVTLVIFGGAGDLAHRKLLPALYNLHVDGSLPALPLLVPDARRSQTMTTARLRKKASSSFPVVRLTPRRGTRLRRPRRS